MTRNRILLIILAIVLFLAPGLVRAWYYGVTPFPYQNTTVKTPAFESFSVPEPPTPSSQVKSVAAVPNGKVVIIDKFHGNQFDQSELEPWITALNARGAQVEFDTGSKTLEAQLKYASAYVVFSPTVAFTGDELRVIRRFVANGGRLLVFADPTRSLITYDYYGNTLILPDVNIANPLIASFGLSFTNDYLYNLEKNEGNFRNVEFTAFATDPLTANLQMVVFYGAHSIHTEPGLALASGDAQTLSSLTDQGNQLSPMALSTDGQVLAVGDFTFLLDPYNQVADNKILLANLADFALGGMRTPALANFPYLFERPVSLVTTGDLQLTSDLLGPVAGLQKSLKAVNIPINVSDKAPKDGDLLVLGVPPLSADLNTYLKPFNLKFSDSSPTVEVPGFGTVNMNGNSLLLFNRGPQSNTFILLADNLANLPKLLSLVSGGDLTACVVQGNIGVCSIAPGLPGSSNSFLPTPTLPALTPGASSTPTPVK
jgi:hypothetical protein